MKTANEFIEKFKLSPHPEGGFYKETLRTKSKIALLDEHENHTNKKYSAATSILFLLRDENSTGDFSAWHKLIDSDETWYFHYGVPLTIYCIDLQGNLITYKLGLDNDACPQITIPKNHWFAATVESENESDFTLVGCSVYPGFDFNNFILAERTNLIAEFPEHINIITRLTR